MGGSLVASCEGGRDGVGRLEGMDGDASGYVVRVVRRGVQGEHQQFEECTLYDDDDERIPENESEPDLRQGLTV